MLKKTAMTKEEHQEEVRKLQKMENKLIKIITDIGDEKLQNQFLKWQDQRTKCNEGFLSAFIQAL